MVPAHERVQLSFCCALSKQTGVLPGSVSAPLSCSMTRRHGESCKPERSSGVSSGVQAASTNGMTAELAKLADAKYADAY